MTDLERIAKEATDHGMTYGEYVAWKAKSTLSSSKTTVGQGRWRRYREREGRKMEFNVSAKVATYEEVAAIVQALVGIVNNINVTDCEGEEDDDQI